VTFLHRVAPGASSASYGIEVARMAGVPTPVVDRAREVVETTTGEETAVDSDAALPARNNESPATTDESAGGTERDQHADTAGVDNAVGGDAVDDPVSDVAETLQNLDIARMTPLEALNTLDELRSELDAENRGRSG